MTLEASIDKLADAILVHAKALTALAGAGIADGGAATTTVTGTKTTTEPKEDGTRAVYWANTDGTYGKATVAEYKKMSKGKEDDYSLIDVDDFKARGEAAKKKQDDNAAAAKAKKVKEAAAAKAAAEAKDEGDDISDDDLGAVVKPFAGVDNPKERTRRVNWLKEVFKHYGVAKASELEQDKRPEFVALVKSAQAAVEDDEGAELPDAESGGSSDDDALV